MNISMAYTGKSAVFSDRGLLTLNLRPNLNREPVAFEAGLLKPLRFREAISALHHIVISDLRFKPRDKSGYEQWKRDRIRDITMWPRAAMFGRNTKLELGESDLAPGIQRDFKRYRKMYWKARDLYERYVMENDPELWRMIMPYDPVITVAGDVVFFECFSADESSYGCLTVNRESGFEKGDNVQPGTTNVDYSWDLYNHFQRLRTYRDTMFKVDPGGFEVKTTGAESYREEKIDLPEGWLRGFMQIQAAMGLPMKRVTLTRDSVYSILAWLKDHREKTGPRAIRFELTPGKAPRLVLEPWEKVINSHGTLYDGPEVEPIRVWGRRRLMSLARTLPLVERFEVYLLGSGLPSFWLAKMGEMTLTLGLSGWTANDWTRGSAIDLLAPPVKPMDQWVSKASDYLSSQRSATFADMDRIIGYGAATTASVLNHLALSGQIIHDLDLNIYRWRQILPMALSGPQISEPNPELAASQDLAEKGLVRNLSSREATKSSRMITGNVDNHKIELIVDLDGFIKKGTCRCDHHRSFGLKKGPCRHLLAARTAALQSEAMGKRTLQGWYDALDKWSNN